VNIILKCIGSKCPKYFHSEWYYWCHLAEKNIKKDDDCPINNIIKKMQNELDDVLILKEEGITNNQN
jgi:hypothetical protein